jgi:hypothetical protein
LERPEKISMKRVVDTVCLRTCSSGVFSARPLTNSRPRSVPGRSRSATKASRLGPGSASSSSGVETFFVVYSAMS